MATDLFCCERLQPDLRKTEKDPVIFSDFRVINNLLNLEKQYIPSCDYFSNVQTDIKPFMRKIVSTWMLEVCEELGVEKQVFPLAVNYLDRFLCNFCINKKHLQLAASVCIMVASKIRQCQYVSMETLCFYADHSITPQEMKDWELLILSKLQWNVAAVTGFDYIDHIIDRVSWGTENPLIRRHASTLVGICYTGKLRVGVFIVFITRH
ncbi:G1/S-specific cyclin-D2, putative [Pediculus humanus corporis]|uniref:G1/S-specific cyclin-D2, putative n=1 Tax=Pediculus humanus subsp. corporis TaxID=121224 RepID=E0V9D1_PEDHC|nr:G1/S-specific cyclin-D2, putative [Pediculus humanus corporis]EEB09987.1 G1/S-specific cyclin-D2, putative [Pediculus humanus corporis]